MKEKTILAFIDTLEAILKSGKSISEYCVANSLNRQSIYQKMAAIEKSVDHTTDLYSKVSSLYKQLTKAKIDCSEVYDEESRTTLKTIRDENGKIIEYQVDVPVRDKPNFRATISRDEVENLYGLYTYYGGNVTARQVGKEFIRFSLPEIKKLFRVFGITKDAIWAPPHLMEEYTLEELVNYRMNLKEKAAFKYADARMERDFSNQMKKMASRINALEDRNAVLTSLVSYVPDIEPLAIATPEKVSNNFIMLHLSDMHIGAKVETGPIYENEWDFETIESRMIDILQKVKSLGSFDHLILNILGDIIDGFDSQTTRRDHLLPQCMDNIEQCKNYLSIMHTFIGGLAKSGLYNKITIYSVKGGNHDGDVSWILNAALFAQINKRFPQIETVLFDTFFGHYKVGQHDYVICHGKDAKFMKKGMPLNLDDKNKVMIYDWLHANCINGNNIHIIKGDLHTENFNSSYCLDYRNVLSLFGASDYANYNFTRNQSGMSYEMLLGDNLVRGAFEFK